MPTHIRPFKQKLRIHAFWFLSLMLIAIVLEMSPVIPRETFWHEAMESAGELFVVLGVIGRLWSALYVGGRKNLELVTDGPYSMCRNPLYLSSMLAITGICMISGSVLISVIFPAAFLVVFVYTARMEAIYLSARFGRAYEDYARKTPVLIPDLRKFRACDVTISSSVVMRTARDGAFLILLIPAMKVLEMLEVSKVLGQGIPMF